MLKADSPSDDTTSSRGWAAGRKLGMPGVFAVACFYNQNMGRSTTGPRRDCRLDRSLQLGPFILFHLCLPILCFLSFLFLWHLFLCPVLHVCAYLYMQAQPNSAVARVRSSQVLGSCEHLAYSNYFERRAMFEPLSWHICGYAQQYGSSIRKENGIAQCIEATDI